VKRMHMYSQVTHMIKLTPHRFYKHTVPEHVQEQGDRLVREIIKRDTRQMALDIAKWEDKQK
jgi:hypothetical protein